MPQDCVEEVCWLTISGLTVDDSVNLSEVEYLAEPLGHRPSNVGLGALPRGQRVRGVVLLAGVSPARLAVFVMISCRGTITTTTTTTAATTTTTTITTAVATAAAVAADVVLMSYRVHGTGEHVPQVRGERVGGGPRT